MLTVTLLHPVQSTPVQSWTFEQESVIRVGRAMDNNVVLYSAVVSRHHVELRNSGNQWEVVNLGTNGTYLDGKRVNQAPLEDGGIIRLARSGPNLQVRIGNPANPLPSHRQPTAAANIPLEEDLAGTEAVAAEKATVISDTDDDGNGEQPASDEEEEDDPDFYVSGQLPLPFRSSKAHTPGVCEHLRASPMDLFCVDCGQPLQIERELGQYKVIKSLGNSGTSLLAWRDQQTVVLKTIAVEADAHLRLFQRRIKAICQLNHPGLPRVYEGFRSEDKPYLATEMVHGISLWQWVCQQGAIAPTQAVTWMIQLCQTLAYLHQQDPPLVHQGVCPSNLIRSTHPRDKFEIVLVDLGSVLLVTPEIKTFVHDVAYTAPELQTGNGQISSDLYALGVTLAYLLTAQEPDYFFRWGTENYRLYVEDMPQIDPSIASLIRDLTHPQPELRPNSALVVGRELQKLL